MKTNENRSVFFACTFQMGLHDVRYISTTHHFDEWEQHITNIFDICNKDDNIKERVEQEITRFEQTCLAQNKPGRIIQLAIAIRDFCNNRKLTNIKLEGCQEKPHIVLPKKSKPLAYLGYLALIELWYTFIGCKTFWNDPLYIHR